MKRMRKTAEPMSGSKSGWWSRSVSWYLSRSMSVSWYWSWFSSGYNSTWYWSRRETNTKD